MTILQVETDSHFSLRYISCGNVKREVRGELDEDIKFTAYDTSGWDSIVMLAYGPMFNAPGIWQNTRQAVHQVYVLYHMHVRRVYSISTFLTPWSHDCNTELLS